MQIKNPVLIQPPVLIQTFMPIQTPMLIRSFGAIFVCSCMAVSALAQPGSMPSSPDIQKVLDRLDRLEKQNQELLAEIQELRQELTSSQSAGATTPEDTPPGPPPAERLDVQENRTSELDQSKVGTSQRMPVTLTGMLLFNAFHNGGFGGTGQYPLAAQLNESASSAGASLRQTVIGLKFNGPNLPGGGKASGSAYFDFWGGTSAPSNNLFRVRIATLDLAWKNTTITVGQDKPIVAPREPTSLAQVGLSPLSAAGNLWDWQPQIRVEQRFTLGEQTGLHLQTGVYETSEAYTASAPAALSGTLERQRPGYEARLLFYHGTDSRRIEIAPGFHASSTHVAGQTVNSRLGTLDWLIKPSELITITGAMFTGTDDTPLGALRQGFTILPTGAAIPVHATGVWSQMAIFPANRFSLHFYGGEESNRAADLIANSVQRNLVYAGNIVYKLAPNVLASFETSQTRTDYIASGIRINNHYDLALAYLF